MQVEGEPVDLQTGSGPGAGLNQVEGNRWVIEGWMVEGAEVFFFLLPQLHLFLTNTGGAHTRSNKRCVPSSVNPINPINPITQLKIRTSLVRLELRGTALPLEGGEPNQQHR